MALKKHDSGNLIKTPGGALTEDADCCCALCANACEAGTTVAQQEVVISGGFSAGPVCTTPECDALEATYVLDFNESESALDEDFCVWEYVSDSFDCIGVVTARLEVAKLGPTSWSVVFRLSITSLEVVWRQTYGTIRNCSTFSSLSLSPFSTTGNRCSFSGLVNAVVTSL